MLVVVAVSLTVFGVSGWAIAARNRATAAEFAVGASRVLTVAVRPGVDLLSATRAADAGGRSAMAVVVENASDGTTLAVDSSRLAQVVGTASPVCVLPRCSEPRTASSPTTWHRRSWCRAPSCG